MTKKLKDIQNEITEKVVAALGTGKTFKEAFSGLAGGLPYSVQSEKAYRGINTIILALSDYDNPQWGTYKAWQEKGGHVRKGEKGTRIIACNPVPSKEDPKEIAYMSIKYFTLFNRQQIDGLEDELTEQSGIDMSGSDLMAYFAATGIENKIGRPAYWPSKDIITLPNVWEDEDLASSTIAHEIIHSTGHKKRLARVGVTDPNAFGSHEYSYEELIAELGSMFLLAEMGMMNEYITDNSTAYIEAWLKALKSNPDWIYKAASEASKASEFAFNAIKQAQAECIAK